MGAEARAGLRIDGARHEGRALLETDSLIFRGDATPTGARGFRLEIPLAAVTRAVADGETLHVEWSGSPVVLEIGGAAGRWADRISHPPSLLDKLDIRAQHTVSVVHVADPEFEAALRERAARVEVGRIARGSDVVIVGAARPADLTRLGGAVRAMARDGAIWVVHPKGPKGLPDTAIFAAAKTLGLTYTKVARFSPTHTAEKLVVPAARR